MRKPKTFLRAMMQPLNVAGFAFFGFNVMLATNKAAGITVL